VKPNYLQVILEYCNIIFKLHYILALSFTSITMVQLYHIQVIQEYSYNIYKLHYSNALLFTSITMV